MGISNDTTTCNVCKRPYGIHSKDPCPICGRDPLHHAEGEEALEWEGLARMAAAKRHAINALSDLADGWPGYPWRFPLNDWQRDSVDAGLSTVELQALLKYPDPVLLNSHGYTKDRP